MGEGGWGWGESQRIRYERGKNTLGINIDALLTADSRKSARTTARMTVTTTWKSTGLISLDDKFRQDIRQTASARSWFLQQTNRTYLHVAAINYLPSATLRVNHLQKAACSACSNTSSWYSYSLCSVTLRTVSQSVTVYAQLCTLSSGNS